MPTDQEPRDTPSQPQRPEQAHPQRPQEDDDTLTVVDFIDSVDRSAFRRALEQRFNYYPLPRPD